MNQRWMFGHWCENQRKRIERTLEQFGRPVRSNASVPATKPTADEQANAMRRVQSPFRRNEAMK